MIVPCPKGFLSDRFLLEMKKPRRSKTRYHNYTCFKIIVEYIAYYP